MKHFPALLMAGALFVGAPLAAQDSADSNVVLLDLLVDPSVNEPHRVFLAKGIVYRASFAMSGVSIRMRSYERKQIPFVVPVTPTEDASGRSEFEIYPQDDGEIEFLALFNDQSIPVRFRLWSDARATARGRRSAEEGYWEIGLDAFYTTYGEQMIEGDTYGEAHSSIGACFSFRNGPGILGRLNGCALGMEVIEGEGDALNRTRFFIEPRFRLLGGGSRHEGMSADAGLVLSAGTMERGPYVGPGVYGALDFRGKEGNGARLFVSGRYDWEPEEIQGSDPMEPWVTEKVSVWTPSLRLGLGYYW